MEFNDLIYEKKDKIARITLNRPEKLNALSWRLLGEFEQAFDDAGRDNDIRVLVIKGVGRSFSAGADLTPRKPGSDESFVKDIFARRALERKDTDRWIRLWNLNKPTIAQVHGYCIAKGTELAAACDIVICAEDAKFGYPIGRATGTAPCLLWAYHMSQRKVKEYLFTGDLISGTEAVKLGLANRAVPADKLEDEVNALAERIAKAPLELLSLNKESINGVYETMGLHEAMDHCFALHVIGHFTEPVKEFDRVRNQEGLAEALKRRDQPFKQ